MDKKIKRRLKRRYLFSDKELAFYDQIGAKLEHLHETHLSQRTYKAQRPKFENQRWESLLQNKWISMNFMRAQNVSVPKSYGFVHPVSGISHDGKPLANARDLQKFIQDNKIQQFVLKHIGGGKGSNVYIIDKICQGEDSFFLQTTTGAKLNLKDIDNLIEIRDGGLRGFLLEERLLPHPALQRLLNGGLSSIRINTFLAKTGTCKIHLAYLRIGAKGKATDHSSNGGIYVPIEKETGVLGKGFQAAGIDKKISRHPESNCKLEGEVVPMWDQVRHLVEHAAFSIPGIRWIGWDVVVTPSGPVIIEGNVGQTMMNCQKLYGGLLENGIFEDWEKYVAFEKPDGSFSWKVRHWNKGGRLGFLRSWISSLYQKEKFNS